MFPYYCVILRELVFSTLPSYISISNAAVGNLNYITNNCIRNICVTWRGTEYELPEDDTIVSKQVGAW